MGHCPSFTEIFCLAFYFKSRVNTLLWFVCLKGIIHSKWWLTIVFIVNTFRTESVNSSYLESNISRDKCNFFGHHKHNATQLCRNGVCAGDVSKSSAWINKLYCILLKELSLKDRFTQQCSMELARVFFGLVCVWTRACVSSLCELWWLCVVAPSTPSLTSQKCEIMCLDSFTILLVLSHNWVSDDYYTHCVPPMHSWNINVRVLMDHCSLATGLLTRVFICHQMWFTPVYLQWLVIVF